MYGRRNGIRIHGIPENEGEKTDEIVIKLAQDMGANIPSSALGRSHRVGRKNNNRPRAIIAKFVGHNHKVAYLKQKQELKKLPEDKPDVYVNDVFVNEDLTSKRAGMAKRARLMRKAKRISDTWTRDGVIFIKLKDGTIDSFTRDISKAFDRVWHRGLLFKLRLMGLSGTLLSWFSSYLDNRHQRVAVEGSLSDILQFKAGVPQGSILGPLLFLICINDIVEEIGSCIRLFADDTSLYMIVDDPNSAADLMNNDLSEIHLWALQWLVKFNPNKTEELIISRKQSRPNHPSLFMNNIPVSRVETHKHLGLIFNEQCSWHHHIVEVTGKAWKRINILRTLKFQLDTLSLQIMYFSYIRPILEY